MLLPLRPLLCEDTEAIITSFLLPPIVSLVSVRVIPL